MLASELIKQLQEKIAEHGDLEVWDYDDGEMYTWQLLHGIEFTNGLAYNREACFVIR